MESLELEFRGNYISGKFLRVQSPVAELQSINPYLQLPLGIVRYDLGSVEEAISAAKRASAGWRRLTLDDRSRLIQKISQEISERSEQLAICICQEMGKPLWEARTEVAAAINKIKVSLEAGLRLVEPVSLADGAGYQFKPHGVLGVLGPFNFPVHLMHGHIIPALLLGNTVVLKPSEQTPFVAQIYAEIIHAAGLPEGVFNLVHGGADVGAELANHPELNGVLFTGSYGAGLAIQRACVEQPGKILALEMGGKNPAIVLASAPLNKAAHDIAWGAYITSGQRCSGTALCFVDRGVIGPLEDKLKELLRGIKIGDPSSEVFMGPVVNQTAANRLRAALNDARNNSAQLIAERPAPAGPAFAPATLHRVEQFSLEDRYLTEELFGPDLALIPVSSIDEAVEYANSLPYGLSCSVFTDSNAEFSWALQELEYGCVNQNAPTCGASSLLPFGGTKQSGNHRPAALWASLYCSYPVATLRGGASWPGSISPGLDWHEG